MELDEALDFIEKCFASGEEFWFRDKRYKFGPPNYFHRGKLFVKSGSAWESSTVSVIELIRHREELEKI